MGDDGLVLNVWVDDRVLEPDTGDVVLFEHDGELSTDRTAHRIVDDTDRGYLTRGDANDYLDQSVRGVGPIPDGDVLRVVVLRVSLLEAIGALVTLGGVAGVLERAKK